MALKDLCSRSIQFNNFDSYCSLLSILSNIISLTLTLTIWSFQSLNSCSHQFLVSSPSTNQNLNIFQGPTILFHMTILSSSSNWSYRCTGDLHEGLSTAERLILMEKKHWKCPNFADVLALGTLPDKTNESFYLSCSSTKAYDTQPLSMLAMA